MIEVFSRKHLKLFLSGCLWSGYRVIACVADTVEDLLAFVFSKEGIQSRSTGGLSRGLFSKVAEVYLSKKPRFNKAKRSKHSRESGVGCLEAGAVCWLLHHGIESGFNET